MAISPVFIELATPAQRPFSTRAGQAITLSMGGRKMIAEISKYWFVQLSGGGVVLKNVEFGQYAYATNFQNGGRVFASNNLITWDLSQDEDEWTISLPGTNYVIEIDNANEANGGSIILWENLGLKHQRWILEKISNGQPQQLQEQQSIPQEYSSKPLEKIFQPPEPFAVSPGIYYLRNVMSGTLITLYGGSTDEGAEISGYEYSGGNQQKWQLQSTGHGQNMTIRNQSLLTDHKRTLLPPQIVVSASRPLSNLVMLLAYFMDQDRTELRLPFGTMINKIIRSGTSSMHDCWSFPTGPN